MSLFRKSEVMKFKAGDKVKVRKDLKNGYFDIGNLEDYQNDKIFTIKNGKDHRFYGYVYKLLEDETNYDFKEEMLISAEEEIMLKGVKNEQGYYEIRIPKEIRIYSYGGNGDYDYIKCIKKEEILDDIEKEYLSAVIKPFRDRVKHIIKIKGCRENEYIAIYIKSINEDGERVPLPYFKKNTMYKGMEEHKGYTLEELGL